jgi:predicted transposase/invertase (TIGR01784 family)
MFPHQPHDRYARYALGIPQVASDLIRLSVPPAMFERIDMSTLTLGQESFVDEQMVKHLADVCYTAQSKNGASVRVNILFEHKSEQPETAIYFQFLRYIVQVHSSELKQSRKPTVVIPILLYHGSRPFKKERMEDLFTDYSEEFREVIPHYVYYVADMSHRSEDDYSVIISALTLLFVRALISGRNPNIAVDSWREFCNFASTNQLTGVEKDLIYTTIVYLSSTSPEFNNLIFGPMVNENEVLLKDHLKDAFTPEYFRLMLERIDNVNEIMAKGEKKGREEGIALGIEKARALTIGTFLLKMPDMSDEEVSNLFDVTVDYVKDLREKMKAK